MANLSNINNKFLFTDGDFLKIGNLAPINNISGTESGISITNGNCASITLDNSAAQGKTFSIYSAVNGSLNFYDVDANSGRLIIDSSGNATFAGNVGIGAAASDGNLHVRKTGVNTGITNVLMNANFADGSNGTGLSIGYRTDETTAVIAARTATGNIAFYSYDAGWSESMRIKNNGNVGIGVTLPSQKLQVDGGATGLNQGIPATSGTTQNGILRLTSGSAVYGETFDFGMNVGPTYAWIQATNKGSLAVNYNLALNPNGGNVGIGTNSPDYKLDIEGTSPRIRVKETSSNTSATMVEVENSDGRGAMLGIGGSGRTDILANRGYINAQSETDGLAIGTEGTDPILFYTQGVATSNERMRITSEGNVGIGRTSDTAKKLDVLGAGLRLMDTSSYSSITIGASGWQAGYPYQRLDTFNSDGTGYYWALGHRKTDGTKTIRMLVPDTSTRYVSVIDALYVQSFTSNELGGSGNYPSFSTNVVIRNNGVSYINGGNVGIGATSPGAKLEINAQGGGVGGYTGFKMKYGTSSVQSLYIGQVTAGNGAFIGTAQYRNGGYWQTEGTASSVISLDAAGNIRFSTNSGLTANTDFNISHRMSVLTNGELVLGSNSTTTISTDAIHSLGNVNRPGLTSAMHARLVTQERTGNWISFVDGTPTHYGTISRSGSGVNYGSNSDYRLKENVLDLTNSINKVKLLSPKTFNFIDRPDTTVTGFLAHEVQEIVSEAVTGEKDGTITTGNVINDSDGTILEQNITEPEKLETGTSFTAIKTEPKYQQIDQAKLVPVLIGALKELIAKVEKLENK